MVTLCSFYLCYLISRRFEAAKKEAHAVDRRLAENLEDEATLEKTWPFLGVPLTVKEAFQLQGIILCIFLTT